MDSRGEEAVSLGVLVTMVWFPVGRNIPPDILTGLDSLRACLTSTKVCGFDGGTCVVAGLLSCFSGRDETGWSRSVFLVSGGAAICVPLDGRASASTILMGTRRRFGVVTLGVSTA